MRSLPECIPTLSHEFQRLKVVFFLVSLTGSATGKTQMPVLIEHSDDWCLPSVVNCRTSSNVEVTTRSAKLRSDVTGHVVTLHTSQSLRRHIRFASYDLQYDSDPIFRITFEISNEGIYKANVTWSDSVQGASYANYTIGSNGHIKGYIDNRPFRPFSPINASRSTFDNGESLPSLTTPDAINLSMFDTVSRLTGTIGKCCRNSNSLVDAERRR